MARSSWWRRIAIAAGESFPTLEVPLRVTRIAETGYHAVKGTPTDCVHLAVNELVRPEPDMVVAGINHGANLGMTSSTRARWRRQPRTPPRLPSLAISLVGKTHFATAAHYAAQLVRGMMVHPLPADQILNVNVPDLPLDQIKGIRVTRLGNRHRAESVICSEDPVASPSTGLARPAASKMRAKVRILPPSSRATSRSPLTIDMTAYSSLAGLGAWLDLQG